jgi:hypothetical protein
MLHLACRPINGEWWDGEWWDLQDGAVPTAG